MSANPVGVYIPVSEVFPDIQSDFRTFKTLLNSLSLTDTLFWCARLNLVISDPSEGDHVAKQQFAISQFLRAEDIKALNKFAQKSGGSKNVIVFFRGQLLELIRWVTLHCENQPGDGNTFEREEVRRSFAKAALIASDVWAKRVFGNAFSLDGGVELGRQRALGSIRKSIESTSIALDLSKSLGRGWDLFSKYLPNGYRTFEKEFEVATGFSVKEYYICLCTIITSFMTSKRNNGIFDSATLGKSTPYAEVLLRYLDLESQSVDELRASLWGQSAEKIKGFDDVPPYDYRPLRERPIIRARDGRAIIVDPVFYGEKASVGPLFHLLKENPPSEKVNQIFGAFGKAFEEYSCDILRRMFPSTNGVLSKRLGCNIIIKERNQSRGQIEIDACLDDVAELVLFEIKAVWLREDEIIIDEYEKFLRHLRMKYGATKGGSCSQRIKGIGQLARIICILASGGCRNYNKKFSDVRLVYPVLVVHDPFLDAPAYGNFLANEFKACLSPDGEFPSGEIRKGRLRIAPLIIMTIDDLENLETSIEHFGLRDLLADYSTKCPDRLTSLHNFIAFSEYGKKMYHSRSVASKASEILKETQEAVFPTYKSE
jgi:hypothetical protein